MDQQTKQKIAKCLELSMEIEGASFDSHTNANTVNVFKIEDGAFVWDYRAWYGWDSPDSLDRLIITLANLITVNNLKHAKKI